MMETEKVTATQSTTVTDITVFDEKNNFENTINQAWRRPEPEAVQQLLQFAKLPNELDKKIYELAFRLSSGLRERKTSAGKAGIVQGLLQEFSLSSHEGVALMCLAEALLRIPVRRIGCCNGRPQRIAAPEIAIIVGIRAGGFIMRSIVSRFLGNRRRILDGLQLIDVIDKHIIGLALDGRIRGCICIAAIR